MKCRLILAAVAAVLLASCGGVSKYEYKLWTQEGEADGALQFVQALADEFAQSQEPKIKITVENRETETLREDFITASKAGVPADMLWTVSDQAGSFMAADVILPVETIQGLDLDRYLPSALRAVTMKDTDGQEHVYGIPVYNGNHVMLMYNKALLKDAPVDTADMIAKARQLTVGDSYGLVYDMVEPFYLAPWVYGFGGNFFEEDGRTPALNTPAMVKALQFVQDLKYKYAIIPPECNYNTAVGLFKEGKAAMMINGDWALADFQSTFGENLGITRLPLITQTGTLPAPFTSGKFLFFSKKLNEDPERLKIMVDFANFVTNKKNQLQMVSYLTKLPALKEALEEPKLVEDEIQSSILKASASALEAGTPMPAVPELRAVWDSIRPKLADVYNRKLTPEEAAVEMQDLVTSTLQNR